MATKHLHTDFLALAILTFFFSCKSSDPVREEASNFAKVNDTSSIDDIPHTTFSIHDSKDIHTRSTYKLPNGDSIIIENGYPRGGDLDSTGVPFYVDDHNRSFGCGVIWSRITNLGKATITLYMSFPGEDIIFPEVPDSYCRLYIMPDTMSEKKIRRYNYGLTGFKSFLDAHYDEKSRKEIKIDAGHTEYFLVGILMHAQQNGATRTGLTATGKQLHYWIEVGGEGRVEFDCGEIIL